MNQNLKNNLVIVSSPFILTGMLVVLGYRLLTAQTPEAKVTIPQQTSAIEILTTDITEVIQPTTPTPQKTVARIQTVPDNRAELAEAINSALNNQINTLYLSIPINVTPDANLVLANVNSSSEENIARWVKKTITTAHQNGLHIILAFTLNATNVVTDPVTFTKNYQDFSIKWTKLATEFGVGFFSSGLTLGHPIFSNLTPQQMNQIVKGTHQTVRQYYTGKIGVNICCQLPTTAAPTGYNFITIIPTQDLTELTLIPEAESILINTKMTHIFTYDRSIGLVRQVER